MNQVGNDGHWKQFTSGGMSMLCMYGERTDRTYFEMLRSTVENNK